MIKVAISGSTGLVGSRITELLSQDFTFIPLLQDEISIVNKDQVREFISQTEFDIFLHLAAYTNVDGAEKERNLAYKINVEGTRNVFEEVEKKGKKFIIISTGFVFDGVHSPFFEDSPPNPIGYYGQTKYESEQLVKDKAMIVRIDTPYRKSFEARVDFVRTMVSLLKDGKSISAISNALITPTLIDDVAYALKYLLNNYSPEIFHIVGANAISPYDAIKQIARILKLNESLVKPTTYEEFLKDRAKRPQWLDIRSKKNNFYGMKSFEEGLKFIYNS